MKTIANINKPENKNYPVWVDCELYLYGTVTKLVTDNKKSNIHLKLETGKIIIIDCDKEDIKELQSRTDCLICIRVTAKQHLFTEEIKEVKFIEIKSYNPVFDKKALSETIKKGTKAWSDVEDSVKWVQNLR